MDTEKRRHEQTTGSLYEQRQWLQVTLSSIGDAVITTDAEGNITFLNPVAQTLTGWTLEEAAGKPLDIVLKIVNEETRETVENPATRALREGLVVGLAITRCSSPKTTSRDPLMIAPLPFAMRKERLQELSWFFETLPNVADRNKQYRILSIIVRASLPRCVNHSWSSMIS
jgi:PAS domain-containing protein